MSPAAQGLRFLCGLVFGIGLLASTAHTADPKFRTLDLTGPSPIGMPTARDLDQDGRFDLVFQAGRTVRVHLFRDGVLRPEPNQVLEAPEGTMLVAIGDCADDPRHEIVFVLADRVEYLSLGRGNPPRYRRKPTVLEGVAGPGSFLEGPRDPAWRSLLRDLDGDGTADLLIPSATGYTIHLRTPDAGFEAAQSLEVPLRGKVRLRHWNLVGSHESSVAYPRYYSADFDGDRRPDLLLLGGETLYLFRQVEARKFETKPSAVRALSFREVNLMPDQRQGSLPSWNPINVADLDGDGAAEIVLDEMRRGTVKIFRGRAGFSSFERPDQVVRIKEWNLGVRLTDIDGDGRRDLVVPGTEEVTLAEGLRIVVTRSIAIRHYLHRNRGGELFAPRADGIVDVDIPLKILTEASEGSDAGFSVAPSMLIHYDGDYNGDGLADLLRLEKPDRLAIHYGRKGRLWASKPDATVPIPDSSSFSTARELVQDLDGDGRSDVFLRYAGGGKERSVLLLSSPASGEKAKE